MSTFVVNGHTVTAEKNKKLLRFLRVIIIMFHIIIIINISLKGAARAPAVPAP